MYIESKICSPTSRDSMLQRVANSLYEAMSNVKGTLTYYDNVRITCPYSPDFNVPSLSRKDLDDAFKKAGIIKPIIPNPVTLPDDRAPFAWKAQDGQEHLINMFRIVSFCRPTLEQLLTVDEKLKGREYGVSRFEVARDYLVCEQAHADLLKAEILSCLAQPYGSRKRGGTIYDSDYIGNEPTEGVKPPQSQTILYADRPARITLPEHPELKHCCHHEFRCISSSVVRSLGIKSLGDLAAFDPLPFIERKTQLFLITATTIPDYIRKNRSAKFDAFMAQHALLEGTEIVDGRIVKLQNYIHEIGLIMKSLGIPNQVLQYIKRCNRIDTGFLFQS